MPSAAQLEGEQNERQAMKDQTIKGISGALVVGLTYQAVGLYYHHPTLPMDHPPHIESRSTGTSTINPQNYPVAAVSSSAVLTPSIATYPFEYVGDDGKGYQIEIRFEQKST